MVANDEPSLFDGVVCCTLLYHDVEWRPELVDLKLALLQPEPPILPLAPLESPQREVLLPPPPAAVAPTPPPPPLPVAQTSITTPLTPPPPPPAVALTPPTPPPPLSLSSTPLNQPSLLTPPPLSPTFRCVDDQVEKFQRTKRSRKEIDGHPSQLPVDWTIKKKTRKDGRTDTYYYRPEGGYLRSRKAVDAYLSGLDIKVCKERKGKGKKKVE